ncbi:MAG TPA: class I SAM-dependent methyltransferase [Actinomycetospora sp.]|jgi:protein-L-isoaspartate O-methyltransferase|uniref:class I SAM-dependent methyltransferase n=1 Tax=Actinomycetospora sp. TaxID=1872135 RepID=UPI002F40A822
MRPASPGAPTAPLRSYIFDDSATVAYQRLDLMSRILDPWTRGHLEGVGVRPGWHCLELGGGTGSIAEWLCAEVGSPGSVTSLDIDTTLLDLVPAQNLTVRRADARTDTLPAGTYDLVTCRAFPGLQPCPHDGAPGVVALLDDPDQWLQCWMMTTVCARKEQA